jgi:hypothetical protein
MRPVLNWCCKVAITPGHPLRWVGREGVWAYAKAFEVYYLIRRL